MAASPLTLEALLDALDTRSARVVLPSAGAATFVRQQFARRQAAQGHTVWEQPDVLSWTQWTGSLWTETVLAGHDDRLLLNPLQEEALWRDVITAAAIPGTLTPAASLAQLAQSAWALAANFRAAHLLRRSASTPDARTFAAWAEAFRARCNRDRALPAAELESALEQHLRDGHLQAPGRPLLVASPAQTPAQTALLSALEAAGTRIEPIQLIATPTAEHLRTVLPDEREELRFALRSLRRFLAANPTARAALLVPGLAAEAPSLEPLLLELLAPELTPVGLDTSSTPWHMPAGTPLAHTPIVATALELARWAQGPLPLDRIAALLLSPHLCPPSERDRHARFAAAPLHRELLLRPELDLRAILRLARREDPDLAASLSRIAEVAAHTDTAPPCRSFADWTESLRELHRAAGWPGHRDLTAAEQAAADAYDAVLDLVATLDFQGKRVTFAEACSAIRAQAARTPTPGVAPDAPLQILSPEQAAGMTFDFAVLLRATDANLPATPHAHPLLDWTLQRDHRMPGAHPPADDERSRDAFTALLASCASLLATSASHNAEGALRPSPLLAPLRPIDVAAWLPAETPTPPIEEWLVDDTTPLPPLPAAEVSGGARLLKLQAACGFLAFAELRLGGRELDTTEPGFDAVESGNVLHSALQAFWTTVKTQTSLRNMDAAARDAALTAAIDQAATDHRLHPDSPWDLAYLAVQKERMRRLLTRWLDFELERGPFTVFAMEEKQTVPVGPLQLSVRIDRIDTLPEGGYALIDYKTGLGAKPAAWEGDRPDEPQLPLYSLLGDEGELRAMAFARIRAGRDMAWAGHAAETGILPQKRPQQVDLDIRRSEWHDVLTHLAEDFAAGDADVQPKNPAINCRRCAQRLLCRVEMASLLAGPEDDATPEDALE